MSDPSPDLAASPGPTPDLPGIRSRTADLDGTLATLEEMAEDLSMPKNVRKGALAAKAELERRGADYDVRVAGAVSQLDELANDPNLPIHGRTAIWSIISRLESVP